MPSMKQAGKSPYETGHQKPLVNPPGSALGATSKPRDVGDQARRVFEGALDVEVKSQAISREQAMKVREVIARPKPPTPEEFLGVLNTAQKKTVETQGIRPGTFDRAKTFVREEEGERLTSYNDSKGIRTVGVGFNLTRDDAREIITNLGYDYDKVFKGEESIHARDVDRLLDHTLQQTYNELSRKLKGNGINIADLRSHQVESLMSLYFNAPSLIGPNLMGFIKEGNWQGAMEEIEFRSNGGKRPEGMTDKEWVRFKHAVAMRRQREARRFRGQTKKGESYEYLGDLADLANDKRG